MITKASRFEIYLSTKPKLKQKVIDEKNIIMKKYFFLQKIVKRDDAKTDSERIFNILFNSLRFNLYY